MSLWPRSLAWHARCCGKGRQGHEHFFARGQGSTVWRSDGGHESLARRPDPAVCAAPHQLAARDALAREAATEYSRQQLATRYRIWGARAGDRELLTNQSRARDRRRPHQGTRCLLSPRLLDVMECGKTKDRKSTRLNSSH